MSDDIKMDFSADIDAARKKRVAAFKLNVEAPVSDEVKEIFEGETDAEKSAEGVAEKSAEQKEAESLNGTSARGKSKSFNKTAEDNKGSQIDTEAPSRMMADDFSDKYSLHKYTDAAQINDDSETVEEFDGEERAVVDGEDDPSLEISSFSNAEQKYKMDKAERKALREYKKSEKARIKEKADKNGCLFRFIWLCMILAVSVVLGMFLWNGASDLLGINRPEEGETVVLDVPANANFEQVVEMLMTNNLIKEENFFRLYATLTNSTDGFEEGIYTMRPNMDYEAILTTLQCGQVLSETVTIQFKEGMTVRQIAEALEDKKVCKASKFLEFCNSDEFDDEYSFLEEINRNEKCAYKLEGYLFPDTYEFYIGEDADDSVRRFLNNFEYKVCEQTSNISGYTDAVTIEKVLKDRGFSINEVINMAALVQAEAANINDMYVVSSVFYNRLDTLGTGGISPYGDYDLNKLKSDATLYYPYSAQEDIPADIAATFKSDYNTYNIEGLPPGAICNPGLDAIDAAINPDSTDYYYFCHKAPSETDGAKPYYASTFVQHQINMAEAGLS